MALINALALAGPSVLLRLARHCSSVGLEDMRLPSSLTEPISKGTCRESAGACSKKESSVTVRPSRIGAQPTRGFGSGGAPRPKPCLGGLSLAMAALPALLRA